MKAYIVEAEKVSVLKDCYVISELVRCRDCQYFYDGGYCLKHTHNGEITAHSPDWFCADGVMKNE